MSKQEYNVGETIKKYRQKLGFTHYRLAKLAGIAIRTLTKVEAGATPDPRISTVKKIADALGVSIEDLLKN